MKPRLVGFPDLAVNFVSLVDERPIRSTGIYLPPAVRAEGQLEGDRAVNARDAGALWSIC